MTSRRLEGMLAAVFIVGIAVLVSVLGAGGSSSTNCAPMNTNHGSTCK